MKSSSIDFAPRGFRRAIVRTKPVAWALLCIGIVSCIAVGMTAWTLDQRYRAEEGRVKQLQVQLADNRARQPLPKKWTVSASQADAVNQATAQLNLPWRDVLDAIEAATPATVALLALEPDARKQVLKGLAEARSSEAMIAYIEQLKQQSYFDAVVLTRHDVNEQDTNKPLRFQFEARWTGGGE
ncbi:hypothetical protein D3870_03940 [Noviherbaspirillum cavernae]|uniref:Pilus assembly protein n=1 Tax=Noviherbaspirillum cavernae TaxID=2320862 RepID=A0A418WYN5_9BURK|nr:PilN domain-containing protein [Noviherbaspirillum cavernae]RJG05281.1 hypothetical protein D3870_03940 [Noviherbaspirillum cavernae]